MKVGLSTSVIQRGHTGVARYVFALTKALLDLPRAPELTLFVLAEDRPLFGFAEGRVRFEMVPESYRPAVRDIAWHQMLLPGRARQLGLDVLHVPSYRRLLWPRPCALVATIHDLAPFHVAEKYDAKRMLYGRAAVPPLARRQDEIIVPSTDTARDVARFLKVPGDRLTVAPHAVERGRFFASDRAGALAAVTARHALNRPYFLYVSRLEHPGKNHVRLIEAFAAFKARTGAPHLLALAGCDWTGAPSVRSAAARSSYQADIRFLGFVPDEGLPELYRAAVAAVHPSLHEGFGFPPIEAMACGCPVLTTHGGALAEVCGDAGLIVKAEDVFGMASGLGQLAAEEHLREQLIEAGLRNAARFDWARSAAVTDAVYRRAAARYQGGSIRKADDGAASETPVEPRERWSQSEPRQGAHR